VGASNGIVGSGKLGHADGLVDGGVVHTRSLGKVLIDMLSGVVVLSLLSLSLDDRLDLLYDMSVNMLPNLGGINGCRVSLLAAGEGVLSLSLGRVLGSVLVPDVGTTLSVYFRSLVLVVGVLLLLVVDGLNLLVNVDFLSLSVYDWGDLVVGML